MEPHAQFLLLAPVTPEKMSRASKARDTVPDSDAPAFAAAIDKSPFSGRHKKGGAGPRERKVATSVSADRDFVAAQEGRDNLGASWVKRINQ